jgi:hypothetical protein
MAEPERGGVTERSPEPVQRDAAESVRCAIRAVAAAQRLEDAACPPGERWQADPARRRADHDRRGDEGVGVDLARTALRDAVGGYVRALRASGEPSERMLVQVKGVLRETLTDGLPSDERARLHDDVVRWGIEAYYRPE